MWLVQLLHHFKFNPLKTAEEVVSSAFKIESHWFKRGLNSGEQEENGLKECSKVALLYQ